MIIPYEHLQCYLKFSSLCCTETLTDIQAKEYKPATCYLRVSEL